MQEQQKIIAIVGSTASGKSELAVLLARKIKKHKLGGYRGAEIISADSRQVYKYLDVGTNKVLGTWTISRRLTSEDNETKNLKVFTYKSVSHHCIDFVHPRKIFTVAEYKTCAEKAISEITNRGNMPILVGGTGFYIQAVVDGLVLSEVPPNEKLRELLEKKSTAELYILLQKLDPERAANIDAKNPRRLMRAIEIVKETRVPIPHLQHKNNYHVLLLGMKKTDVELRKAIEKRSKKQILGVLKEIKLLKKLHISEKRIRELGFEYSLALNTISRRTISRRLTSGDLAGKLIKENWRYAKRQMTWFKRDKRIEWITTKKDAERLVCIFLQ